MVKRITHCEHASTRKTHSYPVAPGYKAKLCHECWGAENKSRRAYAKHEGATISEKRHDIPKWPAR